MSTPPPPYQADHAAPHIKEIAELKSQNTRLLAMLEHLILNGATSNTTAYTPNPVDTPGTRTTATNTTAPLAAGDVQCHAGENNTCRIFGQESTTHITGECVKAIVDEALLTDSWGTASMFVMLEMAKLIYSVPENQTWYALDGLDAFSIAYLTHTERGWVFSGSQAMGRQIGQMILRLLTAMQTSEDTSEDTYVYLLRYMQEHSHNLSGCADTFSPLSRYIVDNRMPYHAQVHRDQLHQVVIEVMPTVSTP